MDLQERLRRLAQARAAAEAAQAAHRAAAAPSGEADHRPPPRLNEPPIEEVVAGRWATASGLRCYVVEHCYPLEHGHGGAPLGDVLRLPEGIWQPFLPAASGDLALGQALFLDTETTGLAQGAGTYVFLVGVGLFAEGQFRVRQYFMPDFKDEAALLALVDADLAAAGGLVSFNGRSFDWPLLRTRYLLARQRPAFSGEPHLDLLHPARRLWRRRLASCALSSLEANVLAVRREAADVPGYLIPELYHDYVRYGRTLPLKGVFYHNELDILSMVTLAQRIGACLTQPEHLNGDAHPDALAVGQLHERSGRVEEALAAYRLAEGEAGVRGAARRQRSLLLKRLGRWDEAVALWREGLGGAEAYPYVELAKYCEHQARDAAQALELTGVALERLAARAFACDALTRHQLQGELEHRRARLERLLARAGGAPTDEP